MSTKYYYKAYRECCIISMMHHYNVDIYMEENKGMIITLIAAIISGVLATAITLYVNHCQQIKQQKIRLVEEIFGYRYQLVYSNDNRSEFLQAINRVPIIFHKNEKVVEAYNNFYESACSNNVVGNVKNDKLITLIKAMCKDAQIQCDDWNDSMYERVFR